ncbi:hypothetical protein CsatA_000609 [Cannabis sativa]
MHCSTIFSTQQLEQFATILWCIWSEQNKERHGTRPKPADALLYFAYSYLEEFHCARKDLKQSVACRSPANTSAAEEASWMNPPSGHLKLNTDATIDIRKQVSGFGVVVRNSLGDIVAATSIPFKGCFKPEIMEALALMHSLQWLHDLKLPVHLIETDSLLSSFCTFRYIVAAGYKALHDQPVRVHWDKIVWNRFNIPKHSFIAWLVMLGKLKTKERLMRFRVIEEDLCLLCKDSSETIEHMFYSCTFSTNCLFKIKEWLCWEVTAVSLKTICRWLSKARCNGFKKKVYTAVVIALIYLIWCT